MKTAFFIRPNHPYFLLIFLILFSKTALPFNYFSGFNNSFNHEEDNKLYKILIDGKRSNHSELRKIIPLNIKEVNFVTNPEETSKKGKKTNAIIEVTLFNPNRPEPEIPDTLQVRINGMKITDFENQPSPLLVFDDNIVRDQNPNNIDTKQVKWIDFHLADAVTKEYGEKGMIGLIEAQLIYPDGLFIDYEDEPEFPAGESALRAFIKNNMVYPVEAIKDSLQGKVYVSFVVSKTGKIENVEISRGIHPLLDKEAIRVISLMPDWKPGVQYYPGKIGAQKMAFTFRYTIPVNFKLSDVKDNP